MATVRPDIQVRIGSGPTDASATPVAIDASSPYVEWTLPSDLANSVVAFAVKISNIETDGSAYATSGPTTSTDNFYLYPTGAPFGSGFDGLCQVVVAFDTGDGTYAYASAPLIFVFTQNLDQMYAAPSVDISWAPGTDPDNRPTNASRMFRLQIAEEPLFLSPVYDDAAILDLIDPLITFAVPPLDFVPDTGKKYCYRVCQSDSLDWSAWSHVDAFWNLATAPPVVRINSITPTLNSTGDLTISFTVTESNNLNASVEMTYYGCGTVVPQPLALIEPTISLAAGTHIVTWRTMRDFSNKRYTGLTVTAVAADSTGYGPTTYFTNLTVDDSYIASVGGGVGGDEWSWAIGGSYVIAVNSNAYAGNDTGSVQGAIVTDGVPFFDWGAIASGPFAWNQGYAVCPLEPRTNDGATAGDAPENSPPWPQLLIIDKNQAFGVNGLMSFNRINPHTNPSQFVFRSPVHFLDATGWNWPHDSRRMVLPDFTYLYGWTDMSGLVQMYPDGYDWTERPAWHNGREVWQGGDAWVQTQVIQITDHPLCSTCGGNHWVVSVITPFTRLPCPNPTCVNGFDSSTLILGGGTTGTLPKMAAWVDVRWVRLSTIANGPGQLDQSHLFGKPVDGRMDTITYNYIFHIVGRQLGDYYGDNDPTMDHGVFPSTTVIVHKKDPALHYVGQTRQPDDGVGVDGAAEQSSTIQQQYLSDAPALGGEVLTMSKGNMTGAAIGAMGPGMLPFFWGLNPTDNPGAWNLAVAPQNEAWPRIVGNIGHMYQAVPTQFRWLQSYWATYNTIHWQATGSETSEFLLQVSRLNTDGTRTPWVDVKPDNAQWDNAARRWLIPPLVFDGFWNTGNRTQLPNGGTFQLQVQQYDTTTQTLGMAVLSNPFQIIDGVSNPVSILSNAYEPWTHTVTTTFRCDDSNAASLSISRMWYSLDDGTTFNLIGMADVLGQTYNLSSVIDDNIHILVWNSSNYNVTASDNVRIQIETFPTSTLGEIQVPNFTWVSTANPNLDGAETQLINIVGRISSVLWNPTTSAWVSVSPPVVTPGLLAGLQNQYLAVMNDGMYAFATEDPNGTIIGNPWPSDATKNTWSITDQTGYQAWLLTSYGQQQQTHGQALSTLAGDINYYNGTLVPQLQQQINAAEIRIRKGLMDQYLFVEDFFDTTGGQIQETITIPASGTNLASGAIAMVTRWWQFLVQTMADGPTGIFDPTSNAYSPVDSTSLENVQFLWNMDFATSKFNSQPHLLPLRELDQNYDGSALAVAQMIVPPAMTVSNPAIDDTQTNTATTPTGGMITLGATLTLGPWQLPGQIATDVLPSGITDFHQEYAWRVAAYNSVPLPVTGRPRPVISAVVADGTLASVSYQAVASPQITSMSLTNSTDSSGQLMVTGYTISDTYLPQPIWTLDAPVVWVSDRRSPQGNSPSRTVNPLEWSWPGTARHRPTICWDNDKFQYVGFIHKPNPNNNLVDPGFRPVGFRANEMLKPCQYDVYFASRVEDAIYSPWLVKTATGYRLYLAMRLSTVSVTQIGYTDSPDADQWGDINYTNMSGVENPSVVVDAISGNWVMFYDAPDGGGIRQLFAASGTDGANFNTPVQITSGTVDSTTPCAIQINGVWAVYFQTAGTVVSIAGPTLATLGDQQNEILPFTDSLGVARTPADPFVFIDSYQGNPELFICYSAVSTVNTQDCQIRIALLEDRAWNSPVNGSSIYAQPGNMVNVTPSRDGLPCVLAINALTNNIDVTKPMKVRLQFTSWTPTTATYRRRSDWVTVDQTAATGAYMNPSTWTYVPLLDSYPYLSAVTGAST